MPESAIRLPVDDSLTTGYAITGGATAAAVLSDSSDLTFVTTDVPSSDLLCTVDDLPAEAATVVSVKARCRVNTGDPLGGHAKCIVKLGGTTVKSAEIDVTSTPATSSYLTLTRPGGGDWTVADFNSAEFGVEATDISGFEDTMTFYLMDVQAEYDVASTSAATTSGSGRMYYRYYVDEKELRKLKKHPIQDRPVLPNPLKFP